MALFGIGGRGKRAPYQTTMYRIPAPLKPTVENLAASYRDIVGDFENPEDPELVAAAISVIAPGINSVEMEAELSLVKQQKLEISKKLVALTEKYNELREQLETDGIEHTQVGNEQATNILQQALILKPNAGGAIKEEIRKALKLLL